jgi:hypothetical protein
MEQPVITFIMNGKTYRVAADRPEAIRHIPKTDRDQLVALLEAVKLQDDGSAVPVQRAEAKAAMTAQTAIPANNMTSAQPVKPERIGAGDVDDLMAHLIMEEKRNKKPELSRQTIYKWAAGIIVAIFLLVLIF